MRVVECFSLDLSALTNGKGVEPPLDVGPDGVDVLIFPAFLYLNHGNPTEIDFAFTESFFMLGESLLSSFTYVMQ